MLEQAIAENTAAINALIATLNKGGIVNPVAIPVAAQPVPAAAPQVQQAAPVASASAASAAPATIDDVKVAAVDAVKGGRQAAVAAALTKFGAAKIGNLQPTDYAAFIAVLRS